MTNQSIHDGWTPQPQEQVQPGDPWRDAPEAVVDTRCWLCGRIEDGGGVTVTVEGRVEWMCSYCEDQSTDEVRIPLDYTEDEGDE